MILVASVCVSGLSSLNSETIHTVSVCYVFVCVSQSIITRGVWGKRNVHWGDAGGTWTLRRFHFLSILFQTSYLKNEFPEYSTRSTMSFTSMSWNRTFLLCLEVWKGFIRWSFDAKLPADSGLITGNLPKEHFKEGNCIFHDFVPSPVKVWVCNLYGKDPFVMLHVNRLSASSFFCSISSWVTVVHCRNIGGFRAFCPSSQRQIFLSKKIISRNWY